MGLGQARILASLLATRDYAYESPSNGTGGSGGGGSGGGGGRGGGDNAIAVSLSDHQVLHVLQQLIAALTAMLTGSKVSLWMPIHSYYFENMRHENQRDQDKDKDKQQRKEKNGLSDDPVEGGDSDEDMDQDDDDDDDVDEGDDDVKISTNTNGNNNSNNNNNNSSSLSSSRVRKLNKLLEKQQTQAAKAVRAATAPATRALASGLSNQASAAAATAAATYSAASASAAAAAVSSKNKPQQPYASKIVDQNFTKTMQKNPQLLYIVVTLLSDLIPLEATLRAALESLNGGGGGGARVMDAAMDTRSTQGASSGGTGVPTKAGIALALARVLLDIVAENGGEGKGNDTVDITTSSSYSQSSSSSSSSSHPAAHQNPPSNALAMRGTVLPEIHINVPELTVAALSCLTAMISHHEETSKQTRCVLGLPDNGNDDDGVSGVVPVTYLPGDPPSIDCIYTPHSNLILLHKNTSLILFSNPITSLHNTSNPITSHPFPSHHFPSHHIPTHQQQGHRDTTPTPSTPAKPPLCSSLSPSKCPFSARFWTEEVVRSSFRFFGCCWRVCLR